MTPPWLLALALVIGLNEAVTTATIETDNGSSGHRGLLLNCRYQRRNADVPK